MAREAMMLSKDYTPDRLVDGLTYYVSEKFDGVPGVFHWSSLHGDGFVNLSRQNKLFTSAPHIQRILSEVVPSGVKVIGEQWMPDTPFKDISGKVRKGVPCPQMQLRVFDFDLSEYPDMPYFERFIRGSSIIAEALREYPHIIKTVKQHLCTSHADIMHVWEKVRTNNPRAEGLMIRPSDGKDSYYKYGRSWGMMRYVPKPTKDLRVVAIEEAVEGKTGRGKGMVGRLECEFADGTTTGCGPGKASHKVRTEWFNNPDKIIGKIVTVQFKEDSFYKKLRQPTFQYIRDDKEYPDDA